MNNIKLDFRYNYARGERLESMEIVYQYDTGRVVEAYVPETEEGFVLNIGFENASVLSVISVDDVVADEEGGYKILATIPDSILTGYGNLLVYIVAGGGANVLATTYEGIVPVRYKPVAEGYIPPDDPATSIIERCEVAAAAAVEAADDARDIADSVQGATAIATAAAETATSAAETATSAATRAETAATAAEAAMVDKLDNTFITGLDESASGDDTDLLAVGYRGASTLRKFSFANLATYIRDKLTSLTFSALNTSNKTLPGAINELNNNNAWETSSSLEKTGTNNAISLSGITYNELYVVVRINNTENIETFYLPKAILSTTGRWIRQGGDGGNVATGCIVTIHATISAVSITNVILSNTDYGSGSVIKVYYR